MPRRYHYDPMPYDEFCAALERADMDRRRFSYLTGYSANLMQQWRPAPQGEDRPIPHHARLLVELFANQKNVDSATALAGIHLLEDTAVPDIAFPRRRA